VLVVKIFSPFFKAYFFQLIRDVGWMLCCRASSTWSAPCSSLATNSHFSLGVYLLVVLLLIDGRLSPPFLGGESTGF